MKLTFSFMLLIAGFLSIAPGCKNSAAVFTKKASATKHSSYPGCFSIEEKEKWIYSILNDKVARMFILNRKDTLSVSLKKTEFITEDLFVKIYGNKVAMVDSTQNAIEVRLDSIFCPEKKIAYTLFHPRTNGVIRGHSIKINARWNTEVYSYFTLDNEDVVDPY